MTVGWFGSSVHMKNRMRVGEKFFGEDGTVKSLLGRTFCKKQKGMGRWRGPFGTRGVPGRGKKRKSACFPTRAAAGASGARTSGKKLKRNHQAKKRKMTAGTLIWG